MHLMNEVDKIKNEGYSEANAEAKLCQNIIISAISKSSLNRNVTIKGGVVMRSLSGEVRRATQDIDLDFIRYSISEEYIKLFVEKLNCLEGIQLKITSPIEELKHQDYKGKRIHIEVSDTEGNVLSSKMDIGVHKDLDIEQEEYCFDVCYNEKSASVLINSKAQMITEKLKSMIRFGTRSTRYKDKNIQCSAEGHVSHIFADRMSSRPLGWSKQGCDKMAKLRVYQKNGGNMLELVRYQSEEMPMAVGAEEVIYSASEMITMENRNKQRLGSMADMPVYAIPYPQIKKIAAIKNHIWGL